jgi:hypothetical protein
MTQQNTSHAVMARRFEPADSLDSFPSPPWSVRALLRYVINVDKRDTCWEPACGEGHMSRALEESFGTVLSTDIHDYGFGAVQDFLDPDRAVPTVDWIITNPPFKLAEEFIRTAWDDARKGVAMLVRSTFLEGKGRYQRLYQSLPPTYVCPFVERVPMVKGRLDRNASTATAYTWLVWLKHRPHEVTMPPIVVWIPPCRSELERDEDYQGGQ